MNIYKANYILYCITILALFSCSKHSEEIVLSPDKSIAVKFTVDSTGCLFYSVTKSNKDIINPSLLGLNLKNKQNLSSGFKIHKIKKYNNDNTWQATWGACKTITNKHNGMLVTLKSNEGIELGIDFRVFNDGIGFRYIFPDQSNLDSIIITNELTQFNIAENPKAYWTIADYYANYEKVFNKTLLSDVSLASTPITMQRNDSICIAIHEAALYNYADMHLKNLNNILHISLVPLKNGNKVQIKVPAETPWRTIIITPNAKDLIASDILLNLNDACKLTNISWIKPMKYIGIWWGMHLGTETWALGKKHGATTENAIRYIDFAKKHNIQGVVIEGWNTGWENWGKEKAFDFVTPYPDYDLEKIANYAHLQGVELIMHHETGGDITTYEKQMDAAFALCKKLNIKSLKTGYAGSISTGEYHHSQPMVEHYQKVVEKAAKHGIMLDVHEPIKFTGICRTYPNLMTGEGVKGMEWEAWSSGNTPSHTVMIPFVRGLAGPVDYTPGIFDILFANVKTKRTAWNCSTEDLKKTRVHSTLCHQLALLVLLYSPMQMIADLPENYENHPAFKFIEDLNIDYDSSVVLNAEIGEYLTIARKTKDEWFLGSITNENKRKLKISLNFLNSNTQYKAQIYRDSDNADWMHNPTAYTIEEIIVDNKKKLTLPLASGGGLVIRFVKI